MVLICESTGKQGGANFGTKGSKISKFFKEEVDCNYFDKQCFNK